MGTLTPTAVFTRYYFFRLLLVPIDSLAEQHSHSYEDIKKWVDGWMIASKNVFPTWNSNAVRKMGKNSG